MSPLYTYESGTGCTAQDFHNGASGMDIQRKHHYPPRQSPRSVGRSICIGWVGQWTWFWFLFHSTGKPYPSLRQHWVKTKRFCSVLPCFGLLGVGLFCGLVHMKCCIHSLPHNKRSFRSPLQQCSGLCLCVWRFYWRLTARHDDLRWNWTTCYLVLMLQKG